MKRTAIICIAVLLLTAAGSLFIYKKHLLIKANIEASFNERQLMLAKLISRKTELAVDDIISELLTASRIASTIKGDERCRAGLETLYADLKEKNTTLLFRLDNKGILTHYLPEDRLKGVTGKDFSFRPYFSEVKRTGRPYISRMLLAGGEKHVDIKGRFKTIFIIVPLYDNGRFAGVLGASIDFASMLEKSIRVETIGSRRTDYCWIIDDRGIFVSHPIKEFIGFNVFTVREERAPGISFEEINMIMREKMMRGESGTDVYISGWHSGQKGKIKKLIAYAPFYLGGRQYSVALATPAAEVTLMSRKNFENTLLTMAFIIATILSGLLYILSLDRRRIEMLRRETKLAEEIKKSRDYLRNLLESANDLIYTVDTDGCFTYINPRIEDYGYTPGELMGKRFLTILTEKHRGKRFEKSIGEKIPQIYNVEIRKKDNAIRICRISTSPLMDQGGNITGLFATVRDRTEHEQTKANLKYLKEYSEKIVASIPSSLLVLDKDLNIKSVNRTYREIRGSGDDDVVGKNIKEIFSSDLLKEGGLLKTLDEVIETGETRRLYGVKHTSSSHPEKILNITASGIRRAEEEEEEEEEEDIILVIEDVTEMARLTEEIRKKNKEMESFVYIISHDLRAPIVSIQGFSSILLADFQDKLDDTGKRYLARIQANVRQMEILIDDLLEFSRIGRVAGAFEDVPSVEIISDVLDVLSPQLKKRGIKVNVQSSLPVIHCERISIYQVFENLIQNSVKYMGDAESPVIEVGCKKTGGFHEFYVKDNGIGIDPEYHQRIFQIFQRLKEVDAKGTGIGLAIVERIAEVHGGSVRVESERGKGATFYFSVGIGGKLKAEG
ncbi:MAG: PAS domain S-box protein [Syntrophales bacterium]|nr:PAS domain S-box protein [Syntrophales bacterium]